MPESVRRQMEVAFGADFSQVRVHTNQNAVQMNRDLGAKAFTHGSDIYFNADRYSPATASGKALLAHELTHVVQPPPDPGLPQVMDTPQILYWRSDQCSAARRRRPPRLPPITGCLS